MALRNLNFSHRRPRDRVLRNPFSLYSPRYTPFHQIYDATELSLASHCPRKALFLFRRGNKPNHNINYHRDPNNSRSVSFFQNFNWYSHSNIYKQSVVRILSNLSNDYSNLYNLYPTEPQWQSVFNEVVSSFADVSECSNFLLEDLTDFFSRWFDDNRLEPFFSRPEAIVFDAFLFNPRVSLDDIYSLDRDRGMFNGDFPLFGEIDIIDFSTKNIIKIICHSENWLPNKNPQQTTGTVTEDTPQRRERMVWEPYYLNLWILRRGIAQLSPDILRGINLLPNTYGMVPQNILSLVSVNEWAEEIEGFSLEVAAINESRFVDSSVNYSRTIVDGLISCIKAYAGDKYALSVRDINPCLDPVRPLRDEHCSMFKICIARSISFLFGNMSSEISRIEERLFHERILKTSLELYRIANYLPSDPIPLNSVHIAFWCGTVVQSNPLRIQLDSLIDENGLMESSSYTIPLWSPFFGSEEKQTISSIERTNNQIIVEFENSSKLLPGSNITILKERSSDDLLRREQRALNYHLLSRYKQQDPSTQAGQQAILLRVLEEGGRRTGQALFGGWARFL